MHPILGSRRRLLLYLLAWTPILALLAFVTRAATGLAWRDAIAILAPACLVYAFVCLSSWYICRARPLRPANAVSLLATFAIAASVESLILAGSAWGVAVLLRKPAPPLPLLFGMGVLLYLLSVGLGYAALAAEASREAERREAEARTLAREAELQSLRFQLNPHFLFNSLHSISALATVDGAQARVMCIRLADFLRRSLGLGSQETIALREELELARNYLEVEQVRFGSRLRVETEIEESCTGCGVPALLLQPLVENAVKHGIAGLLEGGSIRLNARRSGGDVLITIENEFDPEAPSRRSMGMGLEHVRRRLQVRFAGEASFDARATGGVYLVSLRFPCESPIASSRRA
jgi:two-component system sensor histidine kinase AlgZ